MSVTERCIIPILKSITNVRLFDSERGYQGELLALLHRLVETQGIFPYGTIVEQEYQKSMKHHGIRQRPDIILHIPIESGFTTDRKLYNFYILALKLNATRKEALEDFDKLDEMFSSLNYEEGAFINIGAYPTIFLEQYGGAFGDKLHEVSIALNGTNVCLCHAKFAGERGLIQSVV